MVVKPKQGQTVPKKTLTTKVKKDPAKKPTETLSVEHVSSKSTVPSGSTTPTETKAVKKSSLVKSNVSKKSFITSKPAKPSTDTQIVKKPSTDTHIVKKPSTDNGEAKKSEVMSLVQVKDSSNAKLTTPGSTSPKPPPSSGVHEAHTRKKVEMEPLDMSNVNKHLTYATEKASKMESIIEIAIKDIEKFKQEQKQLFAKAAALSAR